MLVVHGPQVEACKASQAPVVELHDGAQLRHCEVPAVVGAAVVGAAVVGPAVVGAAVVGAAVVVGKTVASQSTQAMQSHIGAPVVVGAAVAGRGRPLCGGLTRPRPGGVAADCALVGMAVRVAVRAPQHAVLGLRQWLLRPRALRAGARELPRSVGGGSWRGCYAHACALVAPARCCVHARGLRAQRCGPCLARGRVGLLLL
eukprot:gene17299-biopygen15887